MSGLQPARRWLLGAAVLAAAALAIYLLQGIAERAAAPKLAGTMQKELVSILGQRFGSPASVGELTVRYDHGLLVQGSDLRIASVLHGVPADAAKPMLRVKHFSFRTTLLSLMRTTPHLRDVRVQGVLLELPPIAAEGNTEGGAANGGKSVDLDDATFADAHITFQSGDPKRAPLVFDFPRGVLSGIRPAKPFHFDIAVDNGSPIGITETSGSIGPWNFDDPRQTPVEGQFAFLHKDVSSVPGLRGILTLHGTYRGTFAQMRAEGTSDDPAFGLDVSSHAVALHTRFAMLLDAVASVIHLESVDADFLHTHFRCSGNVTKSRSYSGYDFDLHLTVPNGRVEDALLLGSHTVPPVLRGGLTLQGILRMQAGAASVSKRLQLASANFHVTDAAFSSPQVQQQVQDMSERAQGHPYDATAQQASKAPIQAAGSLSLADAVLDMTRVRLTVPGAQATVAGRYVLDDSDFRVTGAVHTDARASQMTTGLKSLLSRPFNPMFSHGHEGATLPLSIHGSGNAVRFDVVLPGGKTIAAPGEHR